MDTPRQFFKKILRDIPSWTDTKKRPDTSTSGQYLQSIASEQDSIIKEFEEFKKSFFLVNYIGKENDYFSVGLVAHIGNINIKDLLIHNIKVTVTTNQKEFLVNHTLALYKNGYLIIHPDATANDFITYSIKGNEYTAKLRREQTWNIFDEFAMFSSLERYENESNADLLNRCLQSFKLKTNSTKQGLKNAIINTLINFYSISSSNIKIESPDGHNMYLMKNGEIVYDTMSSINKDIMRTKVWDITYWNNFFKELEYLANTWDATPSAYQQGTGQRLDAKVALNSDLGSTDKTDIEIKGYSFSPLLVENYIARQQLKTNIPLQLKRYSNELIPKKANYQITATEVKKINPETVFLKEYKTFTGTNTYYVADLAMNTDNLDVSPKYDLQPNVEYKLKLKPHTRYDNMVIYNIERETNTKQKINLLKPKKQFVLKDNYLVNSNIFAHITKREQLKNYTDIDNTADGLTINKTSTYGEMTLDVEGAEGKEFRINSYCESIDYTTDSSIVKLNGFKINDKNELYSNDTDSQSNIVIELDCNNLEFTFNEASNLQEQGSIIVNIEANGKVDTINSGLLSSAKKFILSYNDLTHVKVTITKAGLYPVSVKQIKAARYKINAWLDKGSLIKTGDAVLLPTSSLTNNQLHISMTAHSSYAPVIEYIHIGESTDDSVYVTDSFTPQVAERVIVDSNCDIDLYKIENNQEVLIKQNYVPKQIITNNTGIKQSFPLDLSMIETLASSSVPLDKTTYNDKTAYYVTLSPNQSIQTIQITGQGKETVQSRNLKTILGLTGTEELFISSNINGFIVKTENGKQYKEIINRSQTSTKANGFYYTGITDDMIINYIIDSKNNIISNTNEFNKNFETTFITLRSNTDYIAYNEANIVEELTRVNLIDNFSPFIPENKLMLYTIQQARFKDTPAKDITVKFEVQGKTKKEEQVWCLGRQQNNILIRCKISAGEQNTTKFSINNLNLAFTISNKMPLNKIYDINGNKEELSTFIITPPDNMDINYAITTAFTDIVVENDMFNKLRHSNVESILYIRDTSTGKIISNEKYSLLGKQGIVEWYDKALIGKTVTISYNYNLPISLTYKNLKDLYSKINYSTDAYQLIDKKIILKDIRDGETKTIVFGNKVPDKIITQCSNPNFQVLIQDNVITVKKLNTDNSIMVHPGYYYRKEKEYYLFEHLFEQAEKKYKNIILHDVEEIDNRFHTIEATNNFVYHTNMGIANTMNTICKIDYKKHAHKIDGISALNTISACDSYQLWDAFNINVSIKNTTYGLGIHFDSTQTNGYALLNITKAYKDNQIISIACDNTLTMYIAEEIQTEAGRFGKSIFVKHIAKFNKQENIQTHIISNPIENRKYYLLVTGTGIIDDIIIKENINNNDVHTKLINKLGFSINERNSKETKYIFDFDMFNNETYHLDIDRDGILSIGSNVDWGITKIPTITNDFTKYKLKNANLIKNTIVAKNNASITSGRYQIPDYKNVIGVYIKINDVLVDTLKNFDITLVTADDATTKMVSTLATQNKTNLLEYSGTVSEYIQFTVDMDTDKVINNIEVYVQYSEKSRYPLSIKNYKNGYMTSKLYDTTQIGTYTISNIDSTLNSDYTNYYVRGYRQDETNGVFTQWYPINLHGDNHIFEGYQYFQFRIEITNDTVEGEVNSIELEVL